MTTTTLFSGINSVMTGHICMHEPEAELLAQVIQYAGDGDHLEIGSMWGGSALLAAKVKCISGLSGKVVCVDPLTDFDCSPGYPGGKPEKHIIEENFKRLCLSNRLEFHKTYSSPWPFSRKRYFSSALIDGNHFAPWPGIDWQNVSQHAEIVIFHDYYPHEPEVTRVVNLALADPRWRKFDQEGSLVVLERVR